MKSTQETIAELEYLLSTMDTHKNRSVARLQEKIKMKKLLEEKKPEKKTGW